MTPKKKYRAYRKSDGRVQCVVSTYEAGSTLASVGYLKHVDYHSPDGFEMGYSGSGPSDLALSILCDFLDELHIWKTPASRAGKAYKAFREEFVSSSRDGFEVTGEEIKRFLEEFERGGGTSGDSGRPS
jgi:hypothetical protein